MYSQEKIIDKFEKLYWRVHNNEPQDDDLSWCRRMLSDVKNGIVLPKIDILSANQIWKKYK